MNRVFVLCLDGMAKLTVSHILKNDLEDHFSGHLKQLNFKEAIPDNWDANDVVLIEGRVVTPKQKMVWSFE